LDIEYSRFWRLWTILPLGISKIGFRWPTLASAMCCVDDFALFRDFDHSQLLHFFPRKSTPKPTTAPLHGLRLTLATSQWRRSVLGDYGNLSLRSRINRTKLEDSTGATVSTATAAMAVASTLEKAAACTTVCRLTRCMAFHHPLNPCWRHCQCRRLS
jgi:hypothetical protein